MSSSNSSSNSSISYEVLQYQNAETSNAIIKYFEMNQQFIILSEKEGNLIQIRDNEDELKLKDGILYAQNKGVIDINFIPEPYIQIDVSNMTPIMVADTILQYVKDHPENSNDSSNNDNENGYVIVLVGLSGTGKGTTVTQLVTKLQQQDYNVITWSNGNIFRCITLLATSYWQKLQLQQQGDNENENNNNNTIDTFDKDIVLTKENIQNFMNMLKFEKNPNTGKYDIVINDNHLYKNLWVSDIQNTILKSSIVSKFIPTVAELIQGEVINFAANAINIMKQESRLVVVLEGREQTVNYVRTPYRFELILSNPQLIGQRRAAQRIMALSIQELNTSTTDSTEITNEMVESALQNALQTLVQDMK